MQAFLKGATAHTARPQKDKTAAGPSTEKKAKAVPWVEKYRPKSVDEVAFQEEVVAVLKKSLEGADLPNLLFYGPPGTGKTSTILAAARELYGPELFRQRVLELNASDERGIQVVREKVKNFAQLTVAGTRSDFPDGSCSLTNSMTAPAQAALRRTMEKESRTTRFCLICNYISRIIEPLTSRCSKFRFKPLANQIQEERLLQICDKENLKYTKESITALVKVSEGDLRKAITFLQCAARLNSNKEITEQAVIEIAGVVPSKMIDNLLQISFKGTFEKLEVAIRNMVDDGYAATQILSQLHESIIERDLGDKEKSAITEKMAVVSKCLADGADEYLQMLSLCSVIMQQASQNS
uniref:AAA+ ATPase domain-containing protein n=1 Tax=Echeneis naucrates TaxID=173247 RepID=A0A665WSR3_ECHNA